MMNNKIKQVVLVLVVTIFTTLSIQVGAESDRPLADQLVIPIDETETYVVELLNTEPPQHAIYLNRQEDIVGYVFEHERLILLYQSKEVAESMVNIPNVQVIDKEDALLSNRSQSLLREFNVAYDAVVEFENIDYQFGEVDMQHRFEMDNEVKVIDYQARIIEVSDDQGTKLDLTFSAENSWNEIIDVHGKLYKV